MAGLVANGIEIEYEDLGDPRGEPLVLIGGLGRQLVSWDAALCRLWVERGHRVIRFDNRDVGLSGKLDALGSPDLAGLLAAKAAGDPLSVPYTLDDMADDALGLMDGLGLARAHVVGVSLGSMIAQCLAIRRPERLASLCLMMSSTGAADEPAGQPQVLALLFEPPATERSARIDQRVRAITLMAGSRFPTDEARLRARVIESLDRSDYVGGTARQVAAILAAPSREQALGSVQVPTLVLHGSEDPLVPVACGRRTADALPNARLHVIEGWGHDLPVALYAEIATQISDHALGHRVGVGLADVG